MKIMKNTLIQIKIINSINYNYIFEDNSDDNEYGKNFIDEYFKENENNSNLSRKYLYNDNFLFIIKGIANRFFSKVNNGIKKIPPKINNINNINHLYPN